MGKDKKKGTPLGGEEPSEEIPVEVTALGKGKVLVRAWKGVTLGGPPGTYTSVPFGHSLTTVVDDDEMVIAAKADDFQILIRQLNADARDSAYEELCEHINATNARKFSDPNAR